MKINALYLDAPVVQKESLIGIETKRTNPELRFIPVNYLAGDLNVADCFV